MSPASSPSPERDAVDALLAADAGPDEDFVPETQRWQVSRIADLSLP